MKRSRRAGKRSVRAAVLLAAMALPMAAASNAAASDFGVTIYYGSAATCAVSARTGTLTLDGRYYVVGEYCNALRDLAQIFCDRGYRASFDGSRIVVDTRYCRKPAFCWESRGYDLETTWRGDYLILCLRAICYEPPQVCYTPPPSRVYYYSRPSCDTGFSIRIGSDYHHDRGWDYRRDDHRDWGRGDWRGDDHRGDWNRGRGWDDRRDDHNSGRDDRGPGPGAGSDRGTPVPTGPDRSNERRVVPGSDDGLLHLSGGSSGGGRNSSGSGPIEARSSPIQRPTAAPARATQTQRPATAPARPTQTQRPTAAPARPTQTQRPAAAPARPTQTQRPTAAPTRPTQTTQRPTGPDRSREQRVVPGAADGRVHVAPKRGSSNSNRSGRN